MSVGFSFSPPPNPPPPASSTFCSSEEGEEALEVPRPLEVSGVVSSTFHV
ncbi:hypothetical protein E2C01_094686 [Portunus trituberculatus]|uniref:Uncharacterized protein n=1 Tax=Portunus trituberculatus TaxID=210409 RepID=A0A5B7JT16_PORTR|nr:hypothetical protein [Portunus trituberculatus]